MRGLIGVIALVMLSACEREPSFDERFETQANRLGNIANSMEQQLSQQLNAAHVLEAEQ